MTDRSNPFEAMMQRMTQMAHMMQPALAEFTPAKMAEMWPLMPKEMLEQVMGKGLSPEGLDARTRLLITLAGLTAQGAQNELAIRQTVRHAVEAGATRQEVIETIGLMGMFAGLPAMTQAMQLAEAALDQGDDASK